MGSGHGPPVPGGLSVVAHDLRSGLAAASAYLDLARERAARGEPVSDDDLALVERGHLRIEQALKRLEALARPAPPEA